MDLVNAVGVEPVKLGCVDLPPLKMRERAALLVKLREIMRRDVVSRLDAAGITGQFDRLTELSKFDATPLGISDGIRWCRNPEGVAETIEAAARKAGIEGDADDIIAKSGVSYYEASDTALRLWGVRIDPETRADSPEEGGATTNDDDGPLPTKQTGE